MLLINFLGKIFPKLQRKSIKRYKSNLVNRIEPLNESAFETNSLNDSIGESVGNLNNSANNSLTDIEEDQEDFVFRIVNSKSNGKKRKLILI